MASTVTTGCHSCRSELYPTRNFATYWTCYSLRDEDRRFMGLRSIGRCTTRINLPSADRAGASTCVSPELRLMPHFVFAEVPNVF